MQLLNVIVNSAALQCNSPSVCSHKTVGYTLLVNHLQTDIVVMMHYQYSGINPKNSEVDFSESEENLVSPLLYACCIEHKG